jgi:drug/metabolite transporter (DMT)-like permease
MIWASSFYLIKLGFRDADPLGFAAYRYSIGGLLLFGAVCCSVRRQSPPRDARTWVLGALTGLLAYTVGQGLFYLGQAVVSPLVGAFFYSLAPVFVLLLGAVHGRRFPAAAQLVGFLAVIAGALVFYPPSAVVGAQRAGIAALLASNVATAYYFLLARKLSASGAMSGTWLAIVSLVVGGVALFPASVLDGGPRLHVGAVVPLLWLAVVNTAVAYALWNTALAVLSAFEISVMTSIIPLETALVDWIAVRGRPSSAQLAGLLLVIVGVVTIHAAGLRLRRDAGGAATAEIARR